MMNLLRAVRTKDDAGENLELRALVLSPAAEKVWADYNNSIERQLAPRGRYLKVRGSANKSSGNAARIAGGQALLENPSATTVNVDIMERAVVLADWHLEEALRIVEDGAVAQAVTDARALYDWIIGQPLDDHGSGWTVKIRDVQRGGPRDLRASAQYSQLSAVTTSLSQTSCDRFCPENTDDFGAFLR